MNLALRMLPVTLFALLPVVASAQSAQPTDEMHAAIMTQLLRDPRAAQMPPEELQKLVDALAKQASVQEIAPTDIMLQQAAYTGATDAGASETAPGECDGGFSGACMMSEALGFVGENPMLPLYFLVTSGLLILLIVRMKKHHHAMGHFDDPKPASVPTGQGM